MLEKKDEQVSADFYHARLRMPDADCKMTEARSLAVDIPKILGIEDNEFRIVLGSTIVEFDPKKDDANREKHGYALESGVDFLTRAALPGLPTPMMTGKISCRMADYVLR